MVLRAAQTRGLRLLFIMDSHQSLRNTLDFFEETLPLRLPLPLPPSEAGDSCDRERPSFSYEDEFALLPIASSESYEECFLREEQYIDETSPFEFILHNRPQNNLQHAQSDSNNGEVDGTEQQPPQGELEDIIAFLVENSHLGPSLPDELALRFPKWRKSQIVHTLLARFTSLKKTREQLVKYCMRKAFKFILELPKNKHLLASHDKQQKFSFARAKDRFLKGISAEKSMNNKFLATIFANADFCSDYRMFLDRFEVIMQEDNRKKIKLLAQLLTHHQEGKQRSMEMVKRMPWTAALLSRTIKISRELLRYAS